MIKKIGVIGSGQMGSGIVQVALTSGYDVIMMDVSEEQLAKGKAYIEKGITRLVTKVGYILMSCDGVHNHVSDISMMKIIKSNSKTVGEKATEIIERAYNNNSNDNMTFILIKYKIYNGKDE